MAHDDAVALVSRARVPGRIPTDGIADLCSRWHIQEFYLFGSILRDDFMPSSDVDVVVSFEPGYTPGLAFVDLCEDIADLFGHLVDVLVREDVERSRDTSARRSILRKMMRVYGKEREYARLLLSLSLHTKRAGWRRKI